EESLMVEAGEVADVLRLRHQETVHLAIGHTLADVRQPLRILLRRETRAAGVRRSRVHHFSHCSSCIALDYSANRWCPAQNDVPYPSEEVLHRQGKKRTESSRRKHSFQAPD